MVELLRLVYGVFHKCGRTFLSEIIFLLPCVFVVLICYGLLNCRETPTVVRFCRTARPEVRQASRPRTRASRVRARSTANTASHCLCTAGHITSRVTACSLARVSSHDGTVIQARNPACQQIAALQWRLRWTLLARTSNCGTIRARPRA